MNKVIIWGKVTQQGVTNVKYGTDGKATFATYSVCDKKERAKEGEQKCNFFNVVVFNGMADYAIKFIQPGDHVLVTGRLEQSSYTGRDGSQQQSESIIIDSQTKTDPRPENGQGQPQNWQQAPQYQQTPQWQQPQYQQAPQPQYQQAPVQQNWQQPQYQQAPPQAAPQYQAAPQWQQPVQQAAPQQNWQQPLQQRPVQQAAPAPVKPDPVPEVPSQPKAEQEPKPAWMAPQTPQEAPDLSAGFQREEMPYN